MTKPKTQPKPKTSTIQSSEIGELMLLECALTINIETAKDALERLERCKAALKELRARLQNLS